MPRPRIESLDYDAYWKDRRLSLPQPPPPSDQWDYPRFVAMRDLVPRGAHVVDVGCGDGSFLALLRERGDLTLCGTDVSEAAVANLRGHGYEADVARLETLDFAPYRGAVIVLSETLEHVTPFEDVLRRAVEAASLVIVSHPNIGYWPHRFRMMRGRFPIQWGWHPGEHLRYMTIRDLRDLCAREGYEILALFGTTETPSPWLVRHWPNLWAGHAILAIRGRTPPPHALE